MTEPTEGPIQPIDKPIEDVPRVELPAQEPQEIPDQASSGAQFEPLMQSPAESTPMPSPMELAGGERGAGAQVTPDSLHDGVNQLNNKVSVLKDELTPQRFDQLSDAQKALLQTKLHQFGHSVMGLSNRVGVPYNLPKPKGLLDDAKTLISWLTDGQHQLETVGDNLTKKTHGQISVVGMLRAQAQLLAAERAINFATAVVSKGADFISKIMQTQL